MGDSNQVKITLPGGIYDQILEVADQLGLPVAQLCGLHVIQWYLSEDFAHLQRRIRTQKGIPQDLEGLRQALNSIGTARTRDLAKDVAKLQARLKQQPNPVIHVTTPQRPTSQGFSACMKIK